MSEIQKRELIATRIKEARIAARMTQTDVAKAMDLNRVSVTIMETGKRSVTADEILQLTEVLGVNPLFLLGLSEDMISADDPRFQTALKELHRLQPAALGKLLSVLEDLGSEGKRKDFGG